MLSITQGSYFVVATVLLVGGAVLTFSLIGHPSLTAPSAVTADRQASEPSGPIVSTTAARPPEASEVYLGAVLARNTADVAPRFEGRLATVNVRVGDTVAEGAVLATLAIPTIPYDLRIAGAELRAANLEVERTSAEVSQAEERLARKQKLDDARLTTAEDLSAADYQTRTAKNRHAAALAAANERRAQLERVDKDRRDTELVAPFAGVVASRYADPGMTVRSQSPVVRLITPNDLLVRFAVAPTAVSRLSVGTRVTVATKESGQELVASVERIAKEVEPASHMVFVEARIESSSVLAGILVGELAHVRLATVAR